MMTPVALITARNRDRIVCASRCAARSSTCATTSSDSVGIVSASARSAAVSARRAPTTASRPYVASRACACADCRRRSIDGISRARLRTDAMTVSGSAHQFGDPAARRPGSAGLVAGVARVRIPFGAFMSRTSRPSSESPASPIDPERPRLDPEPVFRPYERFWPYVDLAEEPTTEELAALDPDLHSALFGSKRPFSLTVVFPKFEGPDY